MTDVTMIEAYMRDANPIPDLDALDADEFAHFVAATRVRRAAEMQAPTQHQTKAKDTGPLPPSRRRSVWAFAAAFVVILVVVGGAALLLGSDDAQVIDEPAPTTTVAEETTSPFEVESLVWSRVPHDEAVFNPGPDLELLYLVTAGGPGFIAVGDGTEGVAVWTSADGINWSWLSSDKPPFGGSGYRRMEDVIAGGPGLVAVGLGFDEPGAWGLRPAVWTSALGTDWSRVPYDSEGLGYPDSDGTINGSMVSVAVGGPGLVAVGHDAWGAVVWTSPDGMTWTRVPYEPVFGSGGATHSSMDKVVAGGPGLVAIGKYDGRGALWTSPDGFAWSVFPHGLTMEGLVVGGPGFVAFGGHETTAGGCHPESPGDCNAVVWTSPDGVTWTQAPNTDGIFGSVDDKQWMRDMITVGTDLVAVGTSVWTSPDGITWSRVHDLALPGAERVGMWSVTAGDNGLVAVGEVDDLTIAVWTATPEG